MPQTTKSPSQQQPSHRAGCISSSEQQQQSLRRGCLCCRQPHLQDSSNHLVKGDVCATDNQIFTTTAIVSHRGVACATDNLILQYSSNCSKEEVGCASDWIFFDSYPSHREGLCYKLWIVQQACHRGGLFVLKTADSLWQQQPCYGEGCLCPELLNLYDSSSHLTEGVACAQNDWIFRTAATILQRGWSSVRIPDLLGLWTHLREGVCSGKCYFYSRIAATIPVTTSTSFPFHKEQVPDLDFFPLLEEKT